MIRAILCGLALLGAAGDAQAAVGSRRLLAARSTPLAPAVADIFVATNGNDAWSCTRPSPNAGPTDGPCATLAGARDKLRSAGVAGSARNWRVLIRGGTYELASTVTFTLSDRAGSGFEAIYEAYPGETPIISGGRALTGFAVNGTTGFWELSVSDSIGGAGWYFGDLWVNDNHSFWPIRPKMTEAPFTVAATVAATGTTSQYPGCPVGSGYVGYLSDPVQSTTNCDALQGTNRFGYNPGEFSVTYTNLADVMIRANGTATNSARLKVSSVDGTGRVITLNSHMHVAGYGLNAGQFWRRENAFEDLTAATPGEHYFNRATRVLTYVPRAGETPGKSTVVAPLLVDLIRISNNATESGNAGNTTQLAGRLRFKGLTFAHSNHPAYDTGHIDTQGNLFYLFDGAVRVIGASGVTFERNTFAHLANTAVKFGAGSNSNTFAGNIVYDVGANGVAFGNEQVYNAATWPATNYQDIGRTTISNNLIHDFGFFDWGVAGIAKGQGWGSAVTHNEIYKGPSIGINGGFVFAITGDPGITHDNVISYNKIHDLGLNGLNRTYDWGGIYWLGPDDNSVAEFNHIYNINGYAESRGIYLDNGSRGKTVRNNLVHDTQEGSAQITYGYQNTISNNIFAFSGARHTWFGTNDGENPSCFDIVNFHHNIVYWAAGSGVASEAESNGGMLGSCPGGAKPMAASSNVYFASGATIANYAPGATIAQWQAAGRDTSSVFNQNPLFVNAAARNFALQAGSPALTLGFVPFDVSRAGTTGSIGAQ